MCATVCKIRLFYYYVLKMPVHDYPGSASTPWLEDILEFTEQFAFSAIKVLEHTLGARNST